MVTVRLQLRFVHIVQMQLAVSSMKDLIMIPSKSKSNKLTICYENELVVWDANIDFNVDIS